MKARENELLKIIMKCVEFFLFLEIRDIMH